MPDFEGTFANQAPDTAVAEEEAGKPTFEQQVAELQQKIDEKIAQAQIKLGNGSNPEMWLAGWKFYLDQAQEDPSGAFSDALKADSSFFSSDATDTFRRHAHLKKQIKTLEARAAKSGLNKHDTEKLQQARAEKRPLRAWLDAHSKEELLRAADNFIDNTTL